jgi:hypothetical protein
MIIGLERSKNLIYDRIVLEFVRGFYAFGCECVIVEPDKIKTLAELYNLYGRCDWVIITNNNCLLLQKVGEFFLFEAFPFKLIFLHHDALSHISYDLQKIRDKVDALVRVKSRCIHFTIEKGDELALRSLEITCYPITHLNTLGKVIPNVEEQTVMDVSFVGHAIPLANAVFEFGCDDQQYFASFQARLNNFNHSLRDDFKRLDASKYGIRPFDSQALSSRIQYLLFVNHYTLWLRGAVLQELQEWKIDLFGGDPAWIHGMELDRNFTSANITNHKPVFDTDQVAEIFPIQKLT